MINAIQVPQQTVQPQSAILFSDNRIKTNCTIRHDEGSGVFTIKERGLYNVFFDANILGSAAAELAQLAIFADGEAVQSAIAKTTLAAAGDYAAVSLFVPVRVPDCCCVRVSVNNIGTAPVTIENASITIERIA